MTELSIPESPEDATAEWLTEALRSGGVLSDGEMTAVSSEPVGKGVGLLGRLAKLSLQYGAGEAGPESLAIKMDACKREVSFYRDIGPSANVCSPESY